MQSLHQLLERLSDGSCDARLTELYAPNADSAALDAARQRAIGAAQGFQTAFSPDGSAPAALFSGPGRTEIGGNHTDHQHGRVLCGSVDLDTLACAGPNGLNVVRIHSEGYAPLEISLDQLEAVPAEKNTSAALVRGVAAGFAQRGKTVGGFDAYVTSNVLSGSGLSSSAAYEVLVGNIFNHLFCDDSFTPMELAQIGQMAENVYFGKPCGLMDQAASAVGSAVAIDFKDPAAPVVRRIDFDFDHCGYALCIVDTGSCHADLTDDYASIPQEMCAVAAHFGKTVLRDVDRSEVLEAIPSLRVRCGDRAVLRALHFFHDDLRAAQEADALAAGNFQRFLDLVNQSGRSSAELLQNVIAGNDPREQAVALSLAMAQEALEGQGAVRVHGGGFAGTIQAFVPVERLEHFRSVMEGVLGLGKCHVLRIRPVGGCVVFAND